MKQVFRNSSQIVEVVETSTPSYTDDEVLIAVKASLISTGTETVGYASGSMLTRSISSPSKMRVVLNSLQEKGLTSTIHKVKAKMHEHTPMGYSGAGIVVATGHHVHSISVGDSVAYVGSPHAEYVVAGEQMVARIPEGLTFQEAAFGAVACIALHGVRLGEPTLGEKALVVGFGLVGLQVAQFARAAGLEVIGLEPTPFRREMAKKLGFKTVFDPTSEENLVSTLRAMTDGYGVDIVYLCAGLKDSHMTNQMLASCRDKGHVVMIGDMGLHLDRGPLFSKELTFRVSRSYGPGRYETAYQEKGLDYPIGFVRWTIQRNLACFMDLLQRKQIDVQSMITNEFPLEKAKEAYEHLIEPSNNCLSVILNHTEKPLIPPTSLTIRTSGKVKKEGELNIGIIGCGSFAENNLLPHFKTLGATLYGVANKTNQAFSKLKALYAPSILTTSVDELLADDRIDAFIIATQHHLHYPLAKAVIAHGKPLHVEKPLALTFAQSEELAELVHANDVLLTIGFNRRCAPAVQALKQHLESATPSPRQFLYRINAPLLPIDHWLLDPERGGGRLVGEGCHFIDLICYLSGSEEVDVSIGMLGTTSSNSVSQNDFSLNLRFANGDLGTIIYSGQGHESLSKERLEVYAHGRVFVIDDFSPLQAYGVRLAPTKSKQVDKGFAQHLKIFFEAVRGNGSLMTTVKDGLRVAQIIETALAKGLR
ncbi:MAG: bi-domain-containing oxidoreductase [Magnetococcus sp. DMHC-6]